MNASDLAETTVEKKRVAKTKKRAENIEESLELVEKGKGINGRSVANDRGETIIPKRKQEKAKEKNRERIGNSLMDRVVERVGQLVIDQTELTSARRKKFQNLFSVEANLLK